VGVFVLTPVNKPVPFEAVPADGCSYLGCRNLSEAQCECCSDSYHFCSDHGTMGGNRQVEDVGDVAYPSQCWRCGGFNADA
jgi:hypothetical protein